MTTKTAEILAAVSTLLAAAPVPQDGAAAAHLLDLACLDRRTAARLLAAPEGAARLAAAAEIEGAEYGISHEAKLLAAAAAGVPGAERRLRAWCALHDRYSSNFVDDLLRDRNHPAHELALDVVDRTMRRHGEPLVPLISKQEAGLWLARIGEALQSGLLDVEHGDSLIGLITSTCGA